jgi:hypothetical protein
MSALLTLQEQTGSESQFLRNFMSDPDVDGARFAKITLGAGEKS